MNELKIEVASLDRFFTDAGRMARRLDRSGVVEGRALFAFESMEGLLKVLTPNRWLMMRTLRSDGPLSIRALAKALGRDYRGVHADAMALIAAGLVLRGGDGLLSTPWTRIVAEMSLEAA